jgi:predicted nuclease of predicted toxin-antitoxin system
MNFLIDAQIPRRLARVLTTLGHDAVHTLDFHGGNRTPDARICEIADTESRVVVTKDRDFVDSFLVGRSPARLIFVTTGNIRNDELIDVFVRRLPDIESALQVGHFVEISRGDLRIRG